MQMHCLGTLMDLHPQKVWVSQRCKLLLFDNVGDEISVLLQLTPCKDDIAPAVLAMELKKDQQVVVILIILSRAGDKQQACKIVSQASLFGIDNNVLYYIDPK